jgi:hypothetical protein
MHPCFCHDFLMTGLHKRTAAVVPCVVQAFFRLCDQGIVNHRGGRMRCALPPRSGFVESVAVTGCSCFSEGVVSKNLLCGAASGSARVSPNVWAAACACGSAADCGKLSCKAVLLTWPRFPPGCTPEQRQPISMVAHPSMTHS